MAHGHDDDHDRPGTDEHPLGHRPEPSLPPVHGASGAEVLQAALPLIVRAASESAAAATRSAATQASVEVRLGEFKTAVDLNTAAIERWATAKEKENELLGAKINAQTAGTKEWHETFRSIVTAEKLFPLLIQVLTMVGLALGLYSQMPAPAPQSATLPGAATPVHQPGPP